MCGKLLVGAIPDKDGFVYATVDCSTAVSVPGDNDGDTVPDPIDTDDDGFSDTIELFVDTDHLDPCANTATANDEADDKWSPDWNDSQSVDLADVLQFKPRFGSSSSDAACSPRFDLNADAGIDLLDLLPLKLYFGDTCA